MTWSRASRNFKLLFPEGVSGFLTLDTWLKNVFESEGKECMYGCVPLGWSRSGSVIQDLSGSWCIKDTGESMSRVDSPVPLMHHDPDRSWITDPGLDHPKGTQPMSLACVASISVGFGSKELQRENGASKRYIIFHCCLSPHFPRGQNTKIPFFAPKPHGNACYAG